MALFLSTYVNKIDKKGRVSVPAPFRASINTQNFAGVILFRSPTYNCIEGFDQSTMLELSNRLDRFDLFSSVQDDLATTIFAEAVPCGFDSEGRISIPESFLLHARMSEGAVIVGLGKKFQIWDPELFAQRQEEARLSVKTKGLTIPNNLPASDGG
jgi:MraZ protein